MDILNEIKKVKQKSIFVNLQKEYNEDRELLELLSGTRNVSFNYILNVLSIYSCE